MAVMTIRIGHLSTFYHTAILLQAQGIADQRLGEGIEWRLFGTGPSIVQAFEQGELDLAYIGLPPAIIGMARGVEIVCVSGGHMEGTVMAGRKQWTPLSGSTGIGALLQQFRGRKVGVPGRGSIHDIIARDLLQQHGLVRHIEIKNFPWADLVSEAVVKDEVAAAFGTPALAVAIMQYADGQVLCPASRLWPNNPSYGIVVDRGFLAQRPDLVEAFLRMHEDAAEFLRQDPSAAADQISRYVAIVDSSFVRQTLALSPRYCSQLSEEFMDSTMRFVPVLQQLGAIKASIGRERIFSLELIRKVHPEGDHYRK
jgi:NitT/TauT family transport system substrate-binding protein